MKTRPACSASSPRPCCRYSASTRKYEAMLQKNTSWVTRPALNARSRNSAGSSSGAPPRRLRRRWWAAKRAERDRRGAQAQPRPRRPAVLAALDERQDDVDEAEVTSAVPTRSRRLAPSTRDSGTARRRSQRDQADGHVDEEAGAPAQAGDVGLNEHAADELPADGGEPEDDAVDADRADAIGAVVDDADDRQHLRAQQGGGEPCTRRAPTSTAGLGARPHAADASVKRARPSENMRRRPSWSPSRPAVMRKVAKVRP